MTIFAFDPAAHRDHFLRHGWVHIRGGVKPDFVEEVRAQMDRSRHGDPLRGPGLKGEKAQHLFEPPDIGAFCAELFDVVSAVCGTDRERMTLSERHFKIYDADADPNPPAHKDRLASLISIGVSIDVPDGSRLLLYPHDDRGVNRFLTTEHRSSLAPDELPEVVLREATPVEISDQPGDVVLFYGSAIWHLRRNSAGAALLYLKCNDFDSDPLGEDPTTQQRRARSVEAVGAAATEAATLGGLVPTLARQLQSITEEHRRDGVSDAWVTVFGGQPMRVSHSERQVLAAVDGCRTVSDITGQEPEASAALARLVELGVLDLLESAQPSREMTASVN